MPRRSTEPLAVALHGITRSGAAPGDEVMVFGAGPIGALSIAALVAKGIGPVTAVEPGESRRGLALRRRCVRSPPPRQSSTHFERGSQTRSRLGLWTWFSSALERSLQWRPACASCAGVAGSFSSEPGWSRPPSTPTGCF